MGAPWSELQPALTAIPLLPPSSELAAAVFYVRCSSKAVSSLGISSITSCPHASSLLPPAALSCLGVKLPERTVKATRQNVSDVCDAVAGAADLRRRFKTGQRVHRALSVHPVGICRIDREERRRARRDLPAVAVGRSQFPVALAAIRQVVGKGLAVVGNEGVEIDERVNPGPDFAMSSAIRAFLFEQLVVV
jgi:hypothetical protein